MIDINKIYIKQRENFLNIFYNSVKGICLNVKGEVISKIYEKNKSMYIDIKLDNNVINDLIFLEKFLILKLKESNINIISIFNKNNIITLKIPVYKNKISNNVQICKDGQPISIYDITLNKECNFEILLDTLWIFTENKAMYKWKLKTVTL